MKETDILIIGGGLTGLTLNYLLQGHNRSVTLIEARDRLGGRIHTIQSSNGPPVEMGATWLGPEHRRLQVLLENLGLNTFKQMLGNKAIYEPNSMSPHQIVALPPNQAASFRIQGGTSSLIQSLAKAMKSPNLYMNRKVQSISENGQYLLVHSGNETFKAGIVASTLPPKLFDTTIEVKPTLPDELRSVMAKTHTWMGESIKFSLSFSAPFWRKENSSGTVFSNVGPITEMYDHSDFNDNRYALKGFLNSSYFSVTRKKRLNMVIAQLKKYYGKDVKDYLEYHECVWAKENETYVPYQQHVLPHQHNGHELFQKPYLNGKLHVAGAETSPLSPGYMDGAVNSAETVYKQLSEQL
jgi:monoamine oxidase